MTITKRIPLLLILLLSLMSAGCIEQVDEYEAPIPIPSATMVTKAQEEPVVPTQMVQPASTPTAAPTATAKPTTVAPTAAGEQPGLLLRDLLACGETLCQADWLGVLIRPISEEFRITTDPTYPYANTKGGILEPHHGVEFPNAFGTPIMAAAGGEVVFSGKDDLTVMGPYTGFYGNVVILRHPELYDGRDLFTLYAHLSVRGVDLGEVVTAGQVLGEVGASGAADGSHLHFEVRLDENDYDRTVNPVLWFAPAQTQEGAQAASLAGRILDPYGEPLSEFDFVLEKLDEDGTITERFYPKTYVHYGVNSHPILEENFVLPDIPPGEYRMAFVARRLYAYQFSLNPGSLGFIQIQLD